jgi:hypothetical protein
MFAAPTEQGYVVIRVIRREAPDRNSWVVVALGGFFKTMPTPEEAVQRGYFRYGPTDKDHGGQICKGYVSELPPSEYRSVGDVPLTDEERSFGIPLQLFGTWPRVASIVAAEVAAQEHLRELAATAGKLWVNAPVHLRALKEHRFFENWTSYRGAKVVEAFRVVFLRAIDDLAVLGPEPNSKEAKRTLRGLITALNKLDRSMRIEIDTMERENLIEEFRKVALIVGIVDEVEGISDYRTW